VLLVVERGIAEPELPPLEVRLPLSGTDRSSQAPPQEAPRQNPTGCDCAFRSLIITSQIQKLNRPPMRRGEF
jgi:hypothetical protein